MELHPRRNVHEHFRLEVCLRRCYREAPNTFDRCQSLKRRMELPAWLQAQLTVLASTLVTQTHQALVAATLSI